MTLSMQTEPKRQAHHYSVTVGGKTFTRTSYHPYRFAVIAWSGDNARLTRWSATEASARRYAHHLDSLFCAGRTSWDRTEVRPVNEDAMKTLDAEFYGLQENLPGLPPIALYNVTNEKSPLFKSTVSAKTLTENGLSFSAPPETL